MVNPSVITKNLNYFLILTQGHIFIDFRETGMEREIETLIQEKNFDWLPPIRATTGYQASTFWCMG